MWGTIAMVGHDLNLEGTRKFGSVAETAGIRVAVVPRYLADESDQSVPRYVFAYRIRISNYGQDVVTVMRRRWRIVNAHGQEEIVEGEGVVGQKPRLDVGASFEYTSFCPLSTRWGTMQGEYFVRTDSGEERAIAIGRFYLVSGVVSGGVTTASV